MIYKALYIMLLMRANPLRGQVGGGLGSGERDFFFGPCEIALSRQASAISQVKSTIRTGLYQSEVHWYLCT
jgi:hypothetical protein